MVRSRFMFEMLSVAILLSTVMVTTASAMDDDANGELISAGAAAKAPLLSEEEIASLGQIKNFLSEAESRLVNRQCDKPVGPFLSMAAERLKELPQDNEEVLALRARLDSADALNGAYARNLSSAESYFTAHCIRKIGQ